jgi:hypothetical protein
MSSRPNNVDSVTIPADMLEKIAAVNDLAVADVVELFLTEAAGGTGIEIVNFRTFAPRPRRFTWQDKAGNRHKRDYQRKKTRHRRQRRIIL